MSEAIRATRKVPGRNSWVYMCFPESLIARI
jgi:hypothetical protein